MPIQQTDVVHKSVTYTVIARTSAKAVACPLTALHSTINAACCSHKQNALLDHRMAAAHRSCFTGTAYSAGARVISTLTASGKPAVALVCCRGALRPLLVRLQPVRTTSAADSAP